MKYAIAFVVAIAGLAYAVPVFYDDTANQLVDQIITGLTSKKEFDPLHVSERTLTIHKYIGLHDIDAKIILRNTELTGLGKMARVGDAKLDTDKGFAATLRLGDKNIRLKTDIYLEVGALIHPHLKFESEIGDIGMKLQISLDSNGKPGLEMFEIDEFEQVEFYVHGLGPFDPLVDVIGDAIVKMFNPQVREVVTNLMKPILIDTIKNMTMGQNQLQFH